MPFYTDQLNRKIELAFPPKRIISLVPSQTELLYDLGLRDEVVGITKFCIHPNEWFKTKTHVGGTKKINFEKIKQLQPDLIIGNKEENEKEQIEQLMKDYTVWMSDIYTLKDALTMITYIGPLVGKQQESTILKLQIEAAFNQFSSKIANHPPAPFAHSHPQSHAQEGNVSALPAPNSRLKVAYFIWRKPFMVAGNNTFINDMLTHCGLTNVFDSPDLGRYPELSKEHIQAARPELILLSSEPYPFREKHLQEFQALCPEAKIMIVDGELFSWYGSRLLQAPAYFEKIFFSKC
jgi:ABC-type Fe3+-hydroxamate transport system substrate-binding protein